jgi:hypothetical protein
MSKAERPITFTLTAAEAAEILAPAGAGGQQPSKNRSLTSYKVGTS